VKYTKFYFVFLILILFTAGCKDQGLDVDEREIPSSNVSFSQHIQPVFEFHCVPCHNNQTLNGGLSLESWAAVTADPSVVFPGDPETSKLVWSIEGRAGVPFMPPIGSPYRPLNQNQINGVKTWISEGALNN
jgi:hypothetical protein